MSNLKKIRRKYYDKCLGLFLRSSRSQVRILPGTPIINVLKTSTIYKYEKYKIIERKEEFLETI